MNCYEKSLLQKRRKNAALRRERLRLAKEKGTHTEQEWIDMVCFFDFTCVKCWSFENIIIRKDHIIPIYQGGSDGLYNLQPLCNYCNCAKGSESIDYRQSFCAFFNKKMPNNYKLLQNG